METRTYRNNKSRYFWATLRIGLGWIFLWAFLDKTFGLGFATTRANAWVNGGSPTFGFLSFGTQGPFAAAFQAIAGNVIVDTLFMLGLLGIGVALIAGIGVRAAGWAGVAMMSLMYLAALLPANNPILDDHIIYAVVLLAMAYVPEAAETWSLASWWRAKIVVQKHPALA